MNKPGFIMGCILTLLGSMTIITTAVLNELIPKIGYTVFQASGGSYSQESYIMNFSFANLIAAILIILGVALGAYCFMGEKRSK
jgi:hypothetical protein